MSNGLRREFLKAFDQFWMTESDLRMLDVIRRLFGVLLICNIALLWVDRHQFFGAGSYLPADAARGVVDPDTFNLYNFFSDDPATITGAMLVLFLCGVLLIFGFVPRFVAFVTLVVLGLVHHSNMMLFDSEDSVFRLFAFFLVFAPPWHQLRESAGHEDAQIGTIPRFPVWPIRLFQLQVCIIYFCTAIQKSDGSQWLDGTAVYYAMRLDDATKFQLPEMITESLTWAKWLTWSTLFFEFAFPILVWFRKLRWPCLVVAVAFHIGAELTLNLHLFHWIMLLGLLSFVEYEELQAARNWLPWRWRNRQTTTESG